MSGAELSSSPHARRHPLDWCVDEPWCADQLALALGGFDFEWERDLAVWDPCCGMGNTLQAAWSRGVRTYGSDLVDNFAWENFPEFEELTKPQWSSGDFLERTQAPEPCSIVFNPPYSYINGIGETCIRHALKLASKHVCALMPNKWLAPGKDKKRWSNRSRLFRHDHPPLAVLHMSERPSMPQGDLIEAMGNRAFRGGKVDYCWIVWDVTQPTKHGDTRTVWLPPLAQNSEIIPLVEIANA